MCSQKGVQGYINKCFTRSKRERLHPGGHRPCDCLRSGDPWRGQASTLVWVLSSKRGKKDRVFLCSCEATSTFWLWDKPGTLSERAINFLNLVHFGGSTSQPNHSFPRPDLQATVLISTVHVPAFPISPQFITGRVRTRAFTLIQLSF